MSAVHIFSRAAFPAVLIASIAGAMVLMQQGADPAIAIAPVVVAAYAFVAICERIFPYQDSWLHSRGDLPVDTALLVTNSAVMRLLEPLAFGAAVVVGAWLSRNIGFGLWPVQWPVLAQLALALVVAEFFEYWFHRLMHEHEWLWRFHATHHSASRLYWLNAVRFHPVDFSLVAVGKLAPLAALGCTAPLLALVNVVSAVHGTFQHANLQIRLGPLNWVFSMAELHRWHHSRTLREANTNYGGNLILWDIIFGTRFLPADRVPSADVGIADMPNFPTSFVAQLASPFRWKKIKQPLAVVRAG